MVDTWQSTRGRLEIEMIDTASGEAVWGAEAEGTVRTSAEKNTKKIGKTRAKMFRDFPESTAAVG